MGSDRLILNFTDSAGRDCALPRARLHCSLARLGHLGRLGARIRSQLPTRSLSKRRLQFSPAHTIDATKRRRCSEKGTVSRLSISAGRVAPPRPSGPSAEVTFAPISMASKLFH